MNRQHRGVDYHRIANLAYSYWEARGRPFGSSEEDWLKAEVTLGIHETNALSLSSVHWEPDEGSWC